MTLHTLGWSDFFESQLAAAPAGIPGRVASANHGRFLVWTGIGKDGNSEKETGETETGEVDASVTGSLRKSGALWPAVGDWVILRPDAPVIDRVLTRRTCLSRKQPEREIREQVLAANIDVLFIVSGLDRDYNPRRIERFLVMANESGARPVVLLNKADLAASLGLDLAEIVRSVQQLSPGISVLPISALADHDLDALPAQLAPGQTAALIGSSGVGKSTILNRLLGDERQRTTAVRPSDSRGRHTTTTRQLFRMPGGWLLMDLPGLREVQLWANPDAGAAGVSGAGNLEASFDDIQALAKSCRFRDCTHSAEPGCAVMAAALDPGRLANYQKMQKELAHLERKTNPRLAKETRTKWNAIEKSVRHHPKRDG
ncbi:MAG TPA: ribosome small subunit-dependent GTPase A [Terracidiphilus sp.]